MARVALAIALVLVAQAPTQFKSTADLVSIYATVRDENGRLVPDLVKGDFVVSDNGKTQPLVHFTNDVHPFSVVVMLDRSGSMTDHHELVRDAGKAFVRAMLPADAARIGSFSDEIRISPADFTSDHDALMALLDHDLVEFGASPVWTALDRSITALATRPGRRVLLVLTDGHNDPPLGMAITALEDVIRRARYNDILMYVIGFTGTETVTSTPILPRPAGSPPKPRRPGFPGQPTPLPLPPGRPTFITKKTEPPYKGLRILADESGGGYFEMDATGDLSATFARIAEELHRQYWMAFAPAKLDSRIHEIEVKVRRRGVEVRARKSYFADPRRGSKEPSP